MRWRTRCSRFAQMTAAVNGTDKGSSSATKSYDWKGDKRIR
jgi:hypothetical protein